MFSMVQWVHLKVELNGFFSVKWISMKISGFSVNLFHRTDSLSFLNLLGRHTDRFTSINQLFLANPQKTMWRFEVVYTFASESSSSALNFVINQPPSNGSCTIDPLNGTTLTKFNVSCPHWFDQDDIKDYSVYSWFRSKCSTGLTVFFSSLVC